MYRLVRQGSKRLVVRSTSSSSGAGGGRRAANAPHWTAGAAAATIASAYLVNECVNNDQIEFSVRTPFAPAQSVQCEEVEEHARLMELVEGVSRLARHRTVQRMDESASKKSVEDEYRIRWNRPLGEGSFGTVFRAVERQSGEEVAVKKIPKKYTDDVGFQREMDAMLHIRSAGGHPNICGLRENFDDGKHYYLALDLISGGEMFDHLVKQGAYSEADAARLVREIASALSFLHGIGVVHGDMKPENVMLSTKKASDSVVKIVDFGCAQVEEMACTPVGITPAYSPPEVLDTNNDNNTMRPSQDMWALGIILYIMLTGLHPYDLDGDAADEEIQAKVLSGKMPPLRNSPITAHMSESSIDLIEKLMAQKAKKRITAHEMLEHPWVKGETASQKAMEGSDKRLSCYRVFQTRLEAQVFRDIISWSDKSDGGVKQRTSLIERSFRNMDPGGKGYISSKDLRKLSKVGDKDSGIGDEKLTMAGFSDLLSENMKNKHFAKDHVMYKEGAIGNHMYFINSGTVEVSTKEGSKVQRTTGDFFGEGALLHPRKIRSATITCKTPVHAMEISREYFDKYMRDSGDIKSSLVEKNKSRKRERAKMILRLQNSLTEKTFAKGEALFMEGEEGSELYIVEEGFVDVVIQGRKVFVAHAGDVTGEHSLVLGRPRNTTAVCSSKECKVLAMRAREFYSFLDSTPAVKDSMRDICLRREFMKSLVYRTRNPFPTDTRGLRRAFREVDKGRKGKITIEDVKVMLREMDPTLTDTDLKDIFHAVDVSDMGAVTFEMFEKIFKLDEQSVGRMVD
mmetsp:Transcript_21023/g.34764  ORF Transcript_21023/g.34764 Transcript_21023/m.34764 type:complete len:797 (+) Transcript_21023:125-2515(+)|eukprot:CAMPEP_0119016174 /NCGR_PEP_ID=MMETSP1176-20130426/11852_1 /TAXON_ID=265551 /ORGANISM="Synedropsis recta cf, Strain CCMP1620" /LENGTH=796 /DNA_ID=CAMNT_0006969507 /DNA_START=69 /DNA_END=2459 /DNA_ORIENTATION=-